MLKKDKSIMTLKCKCGVTKQMEFNPMSRLIDDGWGIITTFDGDLIKVCPTCHEELIHLAKRIYNLTGNKYVSISPLIRRGEKE